jgi:hypothetical protein
MTDQELIERLLAIEDGLTAWELDFIESLDGWLEENEELTDKQREVAERILDEKG